MPKIGYKQTEEHKKKVREKIQSSGVTSPAQGKHWKLTELNRKNISIGHKGVVVVGVKKEKHYRWINDRAKLKKDSKKHLDTKYKYWVSEVKKRDKWKCKMNNSDCCGRLEAHHILPWRDYEELRYEINNGITLCKFHHPHKESEEIRLSPYFQKLISKNV